MPAERKRKRNDVIRVVAQKKRKPTPPPSEDRSSSEEVFDEENHGGDDVSVTSTDGHEEDEEEEDEEAWNGLNGQGGSAAGIAERNGTTPKKPPTGEELRTIKDAADLYMSSSFKLKIDALLPKVRPKYTRYAPLDKFLLALHTLLTTLPSVAPQHPLAASRELVQRGVAVPYLSPPPGEDTNWKVAFEKPQDVSIVGSWVTKLAMKKKDNLPYVVDLAVEMPDSLFQEKDYLNNRFFHKRAYYLAVIAAALLPSLVLNNSAHKKSKKKEKTADKAQMPPLNVELCWESVLGDPRLTALVIRHKLDESPQDFSQLNIQVRILATLSPTSPIPLNRLSPHRYNVRAGQISTSVPETLPQETELATPTYNSQLLLHTAARSRLLRMYSLQKTVPAFGDALALVKVWANQRGYGESGTADESHAESVRHLSIRGFENMGAWWVAILDYLINGGEVIGGKKDRRRALGHSLSSYQLFRALLDFLSKQKWSQEPVFLRPDPEAGTPFSLHEYETNKHTAVFVDPASGVNFLAGVPLSSLEMLSYDAKATLEILNASGSITKDPFDEVFLVDKRTLQSRFDVVIRVDLSDARLSRPSPHFIIEQGSAYNALLATASSVIRSGLGNRAKAIAILHPSSQLRDVNNAAINNEPVVYIGINLDTEHSHRLVDFGPPAAAEDSPNDPHADDRKHFRSLWGPKAELRRFKDGRILESVVWEVSTAEQRTHIPFLVCRYLLERHCGIGSASVLWAGEKWDELLRIDSSVAKLYQTAKVQVGFKAAMSAFDGLVKTLKGLEDELPLAILNISPVSPLLRYTSVFNPVAVPPASPLVASSSSSTALPAWARFVPVMDIVIEFEKSGRWPDDLKAIQKVKLAFFEAIAASLGNKINGLTAQVVLDDGDVESIRDTARLEILTPEGWAFSARIWHDREGTLLDDLIDDKPHIPQAIKRRLQKDASPQEIRIRHAAMQAKDIYARRFIHAPRHHRTMAALSHRFNAYASTVRLVKRWLGGHWLLGGHITEEAVELLCAAIFMGAGPGASSEEQGASVPSTKERGFALVVQFLAEWEWEGGLLIPLYTNELDEGAPSTLSSRPSSGNRHGAWHLKTDRDPEGRMWTGDGPDAVVARRVKDIARATWNALRVSESNNMEVKKLFIHPTAHYDLIIDIDAVKAPRHMQSLVVDETIVVQKGRYANAVLEREDTALPLMPGFDPVQMLYEDLKRVYEDTFKIFYDPFGGTTFGVVFDPALRTPRTFRVRGGYNCVPIDKGTGKTKEKDKALATLNVDAVLHEIERLGSGLIKKITVQE